LIENVPRGSVALADNGGLVVDHSDSKASDGVWARNTVERVGFSRRRLTAPSSAVKRVHDLGATNRGALNDGEARDGLGGEGLILHCPRGPAICRLQDPRAPARVTDRSRWAGNSRQRRDSGGHGRVRPGRPTVARHDDRGEVPTVVPNCYAGGRGSGSTGCARNGSNVCQRCVTACRLPLRCGRRRWRRRCRTAQESEKSNCCERRKRGNSDSLDRSHGHLPPSPSCRTGRS
jgi:hypothetical protein